MTKLSLLLLSAFVVLPVSTVGSPLALEHGLIMLLLLSGLLSIRGERRRYVPWVILAGIVLSLITPVHFIEPAWPVLTALLLPPLMWQTATRLGAARTPARWQTIFAWLLTALLIGLILRFVANLPLARAFLISLLGVSLLWQVHEGSAPSTDLGIFGQLTLAFLLAEKDLTLFPVGEWIATLFSGSGFGLFLGFVGVRVALKLSSERARKLLLLGLVYLSYAIGTLVGVSGVITVTMTSLVAAIYGHSVGLLWSTSDTSWDNLPAPLNRLPIFLLGTAAWLFLGWQAHVPLTLGLAAGIVLSFLVSIVISLFVRRLASGREEAASLMGEEFFPRERKAFLLLAGAVLLWPQNTILDPLSLGMALGGSLASLLLLRLAVKPFLDLIGVER